MNIKNYFQKTKELASNKKGAALVEFAFAMFPLYALFFVQLEVASMFASHLILHHAAVAAARCAIVQKGPNLPGDYVSNTTGKDDNGAADDKCKKAAIDATGVGVYYKTLNDIQVTNTFTGSDHVDSAANNNDAQYGDVTTTVKANYTCNVPIGAIAICGSMHGTKPLQIVIKLPHEGARYTVESTRNGG